MAACQANSSSLPHSELKTRIHNCDELIPSWSIYKLLKYNYFEHFSLKWGICNYYRFTFCFSEMYAIQTGQPLLVHRVRPSCECARNATDSFNLMASDRIGTTVDKLDGLCYDACSYHNPLCYDSLLAGSKPRYGGIDQSKWAILDNVGWISDFTDQAEIVISTSQPMLVCNTIMHCWYWFPLTQCGLQSWVLPLCMLPCAHYTLPVELVSSSTTVAANKRSGFIISLCT